MIANAKTLLLTAAFLGGSIVAASAQSSQTPSGSPSATGNVSAQTHCLDRTTGQPRLKTASPAQPSDSSQTSPRASASTSSNNPGSTAPSGGMTGSPSTTGSASATLSPC